MTSYIEPRESIRYWMGEDDAGMLNTVAGRFTGANPEIPFALRSFAQSGILQTEEGYYNFNFNERFRDAKQGEAAYALGLVWSDDERSIDAGIMPFSPVRFYLNEQLMYRSGAEDEMKPDAKIVIPILLNKGWNTLMIEARRTEGGFGCYFGAQEGKVRILQVLSPFADRQEAAGWVYTGPLAAGTFGDSGVFPDAGAREEESGLSWLPVTGWSHEAAAKRNLERIFGIPADGLAVTGYAWSRLEVPSGVETVELTGHTAGRTTIWIDGHAVLETQDAGELQCELPAAACRGDLLVRCDSGSGASKWGFELQAHSGSTQLEFVLPVPVHGAPSPWLYAGPLSAEVQEEPKDVMSVRRLFERADGDGLSGWSLDAPDRRVRPFYENAMLSNKWTSGTATNFGRWDYPLGVTMYGLLQTSRALGRKDIADYARAHIDICTAWYAYSVWDRDTYGFPSINHQLVLIKMLDNCGSFGSAMLEAYTESGNHDYLKVAEVIADFMINRLERREDGAFYRLCVGEYSADTMWADDLYMSTPFLSRYALITGDHSYLDEAAHQFLRYREYLFMPEEGTMSHVYDFKYGKATRVPWGRGNGWSLFSLSELLERLPEDHKDRPALLSFFQELCAGIASYQGASGLWRQVIIDPDAYEEASCTAMFAYAFARGVRFGWLEDPAPFADAALRAWQGLTGEAIDRRGSVHGVCSGSRYSFTGDYYKFDLLTVVNDNHGTGIMMLAGVEIMKLKGMLGSH
ncbi:glycoside hydrolase family 88/105 protein [Paenibacillus lemnae]|uniref:Glycosyl hydrolase n=1 Tax=Paenibacillus lemnae TaxID=1330551 RepID=A0A848M7T8_PAELE|nr:glycoside hydrolase family 88 protein [Paenibacillus lemnae]NMO96696.1 glycosyl hydrolase [Paenibacillus lemnae]